MTKAEFDHLAAALEAAEKERDSIRYHLSVNLQRLEAARDDIDELEKERDEWKAKAEAREAEIRKECADSAVAWENIHGMLPLDGEKELRDYIEVRYDNNERKI